MSKNKKRNKKGYSYNRSQECKTVNNKKTNSTSVNTTTSTVTTPKTTTTKYSYGWSTTYSTPNYDKKGKLNETQFPEFVSLCKMTQKELKEYLMNILFEFYDEVNIGDGYLYAKGDIPILLTAHMDTVHSKPVVDFYEYYDEEKGNHILSSPQGIGGDDRCGVYMILEILKTHKISVLFCEDEEIGGVGSDKFCKTNLIYDLCDMKYLIELDRANGNDAVFYSCDNPEFTDFIEKATGYKEAYGSFSDISTLAPKSGVAAVNLSCGYYNAHRTSEYVVIEEMLNTIEVVKTLLETECDQFEYIEEKTYSYGYGGRCYGRSNYYNGYYDDDYYDDYYGYYGYSKSNKDKEERSLLIMLKQDDNKTVFYISNGTSIEEAFGKFFMENTDYCFEDVIDYDFYEDKVYEDGLYETSYDL